MHMRVCIHTVVIVAGEERQGELGVGEGVGGGGGEVGGEVC